MREPDIEFFRPLWRRLTVTLFCLVWASFEWASGESFWAMMATGMFALCVWKLLYGFDAEVERMENQRQD